MLQLTYWLNQKIKIKGMYTASPPAAVQALEHWRELWSAAAAVTSCILLFKRVPIFISGLHTSLSTSVFPPGCLSSEVRWSSFQQRSVWFSLAPFGSVQAGNRTSFMYNNQSGCNSICNSARLLKGRVYVWGDSRLTLIHTTAAHLVCLHTRQKYSTGLWCIPLQTASVRKWWPDTTAPLLGCLRSPSASWLVSSSLCTCHHTAVRWPASQTKEQVRWSRGCLPMF